MSKQVLFNGAVLVRPGAATRIDASQFANVALSGLGTVALIGAADGGEPRTVQTFRDAASVKDFYRSGDLVEAAQILADPGNDPLIPAGASAIVTYKVNLSTIATLTHDTEFTFNSIDYGVHTNNISIAIASSGGDLRQATITSLDIDGNVVTETSPEFGDTTAFGKFSIQYTGADPGAVTMDITATTLTVTTSATPADDLAISFSDYPTLNELVFFINSQPAYTATALISNAASFDPTNLDGVSTVDVKTTAYTVMAHNFDLCDWINQNSSLITCSVTKGATGPRTVLTATPLAGGTKGSSTNGDWTTGFNALGSVRVNQVVPLASDDGVTPDTYTIAAINTALESHCKLLSATAGKSERQGWASLDGTKDELITQANTLNSEHVQLCGQTVDRASATSGNIITFEEWGLACILAGMRAGAPLGEPLTHKNIKANALAQDASWDNNDNGDVADLILNGVMTVAEIPGEGFRIEKGITTFTKSDNDAFTEESIVQGWKNIAFEWRTALEQQYTGRPGDPGVVLTVRPFSITVLSALRDQGAIADSIEDGVVVDGFRDISVVLNGDVLEVGGIVSPTPGINFILNTVVLVPASISA